MNVVLPPTRNPSPFLFSLLVLAILSTLTVRPSGKRRRVVLHGISMVKFNPQFCYSNLCFVAQPSVLVLRPLFCCSNLCFDWQRISITFFDFQCLCLRPCSQYFRCGLKKREATKGTTKWSTKGSTKGPNAEISIFIANNVGKNMHLDQFLHVNCAIA